ncbi:UNVERIFIED_CONTAM: hypothetical protein Sindi_0709400 [Sesamum indicum]
MRDCRSEERAISYISERREVDGCGGGGGEAERRRLLPEMFEAVFAMEEREMERCYWGKDMCVIYTDRGTQSKNEGDVRPYSEFTVMDMTCLGPPYPSSSIITRQ